MEVARRLYKPENYSALNPKAKKKLEFDDLPIGVAIAAIVRCIETDRKFKFANLIDGRYHIFSGSLDRRIASMKLILTEFRRVQLADWLKKNPKVSLDSLGATEDQFRKAIKNNRNNYFSLTKGRYVIYNFDKSFLQ
jgi:hypothetical protein